MKQNKFLSMLGLAKRAGKVVSGEFMTEKAVKTGKAYLVIVAKDASENTKKNFNDMCSWYRVPIRTGPGREDLGHAIGQEMRVSVAVTDENFAAAIVGSEMTKDENKGGSDYGDRTE